MVGSTTLVKALPFLAASAIASVNYPTIPSDLTTPFQQRLAVYGLNGKITDFERLCMARSYQLTPF
jgi:hypothetical protein